MRLLLGIAVAAVLWLVVKRALRYFPHRWRPTALTAVTALVLAALNAVNLCAPGWCGAYGFPFPYYSWSDAIATINGVCIGCPTSTPLAAVADVALALVLCAFLYRRERRSFNGPKSSTTRE